MDQKLILLKVQSLLKEREITYSLLAQKMDLSHQAIKRVFSKGQITFENLVKIASILELNLSDLFYEVEQENQKVFQFTSEQEKFFAENLNYLAYFYQIRNKRTPLQIRKDFRLSERCNLKYLKRLKALGMVKFDGETFVSNITAPIFWNDDGPLGRVFSLKMIEELTARVTSFNIQRERPHIDLKNFVLSKHQHASLLNDFAKLMDRYYSLSVQNSKLKRKATFPYTSLYLCGERELNLLNSIEEI